MTARPPNKAFDYDVGYGKPPDATKFGNRPQPNRSLRQSKTSENDIAALLDSPALVERGGKRRYVHPHEAMVISLGREALRNKIGAAKKFLRECKRAGLLDPPAVPQHSNVVFIPKNMDVAVFDYLRKHVGLPPYDAKIRAQVEAEHARDREILKELRNMHGDSNDR